jgi:hypothetical protein
MSTYAEILGHVIEVQRAGGTVDFALTDLQRRHLITGPLTSPEFIHISNVAEGILQNALDMPDFKALPHRVVRRLSSSWDDGNTNIIFMQFGHQSRTEGGLWIPPYGDTLNSYSGFSVVIDRHQASVEVVRELAGKTIKDGIHNARALALNAEPKLLLPSIARAINATLSPLIQARQTALHS